MNPKIARYHAERKLRLLGVIFVLCSSAFADDTIALQEGMKSLTYKKVGDTELEMKIHYPPDWEAGGKKLPAIVLFFGGGWHAGDITQFRVTAPYLAERGMIVVTPEYRTISKHGVTPVQCLADAKSAMRYIYKNAAALGIDASKIAAGGISAGGQSGRRHRIQQGIRRPIRRPPGPLQAVGLGADCSRDRQWAWGLCSQPSQSLLGSFFPDA